MSNLTQDFTLLSRATRTTTTSSADVDMTELADEFSGVRAVIDVTNISTSGNIYLTIQGYDPILNTYFNVISTADITATGTTVVRVHPYLIDTTNLIAQDQLTDKWRVTVTHQGFDGPTPAAVAYGVSAHLLR